MERDDPKSDGIILNDSDERPRSAVNAAVLDYYKKFGKKRDLEQYFSLSTAKSDIRDPSSLFWRRMKEQSDTSDSGEKKSESSNEICRISIKCSIPERPDLQRGDSPSKTDSESPPIITDVLPGPSHSGDDSIDDNNSQKSMDGILDTSMNKPLSPTSSVTSHRKLEWDSLADVGYGNESDRKTSASSLSTLEREVLAQKQQYTLAFKQNSELGLPTAHSTPVDANDSKPKGKKGQGKKTMSFSKKDVDFVEVKLPHSVDNAQAINVNLTKQFSVNLEKDGGFTVDNVRKDVTVTPEKVFVDTGVSPQENIDKEIQTSLMKSKKKAECPVVHSIQKVPVLICLNTLRRMQRRKKTRTLRVKNKNNKKKCNVRSKIVQEREKSGEQVSDAESFEYMPGHMYNQNQFNENPNVASNNNAGNKSSLESSAVHTSDSSKESKYSFTKDLDKSLDILKSALKDKYDSNLKKKLVKDIIQRLLKSKYGNDDSTPDFLSVLTLNSKKTPTTSTSDADNTGEKVLHTKPKKSILRVNKFNSNDIASTSQSAPNLPSVVNSEKLVLPYLPRQVSSTTTDTDLSANNTTKDITSSDTIFAKTSSEELYKKYIDALKREEAYKLHLKDKETFLRQKLVRSDTSLKVPAQLDIKTNKKLKYLIKDLTRNNYDDGSGDASKLEGGSSSNFDVNRHRVFRKQRSHSVFTLSSSNSDKQSRKCDFIDMRQKELASAPTAGPSNHKDNCNSFGKKHECHKTNVTDSSVQVNIKSTEECEDIKYAEIQRVNTESLRNVACMPPYISEDVKYVCLCTEKALASQHSPDEFLIYKCSRLTGQMPVVNMTSKACNTTNMPSASKCTSPTNNNVAQTYSPQENEFKHKNCCLKESSSYDDVPILRKISKSSQTNVNTLQQPFNTRSVASSSSEEGIICGGLSRKKTDSTTNNCCNTRFGKPKTPENNRIIQESTRCLQTEISIHPKISDPTLSDINIINSSDCVKLISELYRKVSGSSSEHNVGSSLNEKDNANTNTCSKSSKDYACLHTNDDRDNLSVDENETCVTYQPTTTKQSESISDNIVIPIQGTKMTLKVSITGSPRKPKQELTQKRISENIESHGIVTDKIEVIEKFTSISAECSKAVQSDYPSDIRKSTPYSGCNEKKDLTAKENESPQPSQPFQSNTYPKVLQINGHKPLLRSNTDTGNFGACCAIQTDDIDNNDKETQPSLIVQSRLKNHSEFQSQQSNDTGDGSVSERSKSSSGKKNISPTRMSHAPDSSKYKSKMCCNMVTNEGTSKDLILDMIQDITKRYSKKDVDKSNKKKCFKEIMTVINYLLDTDDSGDGEQEHSKDMKDSKRNKCSNKTYHDSDIPPDVETKVTGAPYITSERNKSSPRKTYMDQSNIEESVMKTKIQESTREACCGGSKITEMKTVSNRGDANTRPIELATISSLNDDGAKYAREFFTSEQPRSTTLETSERVYTKHKNDSHQKQSSRSKKKETDDISRNICDEGCGCDESSECKESSEHNYVKYINDKSDKETCRANKQETNKNSLNTYDEKCGHDNSAKCKNSSERDHVYDKPNIGDEQSLRIIKQDTDKNTPNTCDVSCGCDESSECKDSSDRDYAKYESDRGEKQKMKSKKQEPYEKSPNTCEVGCGCDESSECKESSYRDYAKYKTNKEDKQCLRSRKIDVVDKSPKKLVNKCVQSTARKVKSLYCQRTDSSDLINSTDQPSASTNSPTSRIINKIKKECEKYQKRCKSQCGKKNETSSSTSINCDHCKRAHQCSCKGHKCRGHKTKTTMEKIKKKCLAYNLILQTSDSMISEETVFDKHQRPLQNIVVRVPKRKQENIPFKEMSAKIEKNLPYCSQRYPKNRSKSWPNESGISSTDDVKMAQAYTVREYLERNRPDFVERCAHRQNCIRMISESSPEASPASPRLKMVVIHNPNCMSCTGPTTMYCGGFPMSYNCSDSCVQTVENQVTRIASQRSQQREVLSMQLENLPTLTEDDLRYLAKELGFGRRRPVQSKIISEREMKRHSEKIYKSLPEVVQKKEEAKKESIKKTNLLMASIFKKNLQKKTLSGAVNLSNYSAVIKI